MNYARQIYSKEIPNGNSNMFGTIAADKMSHFERIRLINILHPLHLPNLYFQVIRFQAKSMLPNQIAGSKH